MKLKTQALTLFLMLTPLATADSVMITTSTSCITNGGSVLDPTSCSSTGVPNGSATAQSSASYSISGNTLTISLSDIAGVAETVLPGTPTGASNSATAQSSISIDIVTAGPVRPGFVVFMNYGSAEGDGRSGAPDGGAQGTASLYSLGGFMCNSVSGCIGDYDFDDPRPITLGTDFAAYATATAFADMFTTSIGFNGQLGGSVASASFQFFEVDGTTPVDIALATPEPGTWTLLPFGLLCLLGARYKGNRSGS